MDHQEIKLVFLRLLTFTKPSTWVGKITVNVRINQMINLIHCYQWHFEGCSFHDFDSWRLVAAEWFFFTITKAYLNIGREDIESNTMLLILLR